jgi:hypothetical protein
VSRLYRWLRRRLPRPMALPLVWLNYWRRPDFVGEPIDARLAWDLARILVG